MFLFHCPAQQNVVVPPPSSPLTVFPSGVWFRPEGTGGHFICGVSPPEEGDRDHDSTDTLSQPEHDMFEQIIWPALYERVQAFGEIRVKRAWAGFYEYNTFDQNAVIGPHPDLSNLLVCAGFSGHGLQHSPAAGRAIAELIVHGQYTSLDLSRYRFGRIADNEPLLEDCIV
ncbi:foxred1 [Symbiodinium microadriaticum]|nr:foxred1 [Symbiodinium microadriaticum]